MTPSKAVLEFIKTVEGVSSTVYLDTAGKMTIGYGHLINGNRDIYLETVLGGEYDLESLKITQSQMEELYLLKKRDLLVALSQILLANRIEVNQVQFDALASFVFNLGPGAFRSSSVLRNLLKGDYDAAASSILLWNKSGRPLKFDQGVMNRRIMEYNMFKTTKFSDDIDIPADKTRQSDRNYIRDVVLKYRINIKEEI